ncbi:hypothetical protein [Halobaculum magnesiiphilum]|uniref:Uncharacterized protein n=1 Tax=Halobaculum magnesiiphilum TaxID=1017351 RepID=A0A8T8WC28_9EURY|nr:hypothetical protein [Halobaculum magnesiiphilum]QZP37422.1 hypothetical protein K6T50_14275 [Halobaculum magnesiiphilum]
MSDAGDADRGPIVTSGERSIADRFGSVDGWAKASIALAGVLVLFFLALVVVSYV